MATGLGKTWLAAFDSARPAFRRVLFVAHRDEILRQSRDIFRQVRPDGDLGYFTGTLRQPDADVVFSTVQTLARNLDAFAPDAFTYVVVDEFHHAAASSYRKVIGHFTPAFLLGLTATPDRLDGADLLALCGDNLVFTCDLVDGIHRDELSPFRYFGVRDRVDYAPIPWRGGRFDSAALTAAVETHDRAAQVLDEWRARGCGRTLGFCVTTTHADFMASYFVSNGVRAAAVDSGLRARRARRRWTGSGTARSTSEFTVDLFNKGLDVPEIDAVLMLRPTESPVIFLQQLGRGLRKASGEEHLTVIDLIGNHRSFLLKPRTLLGLGEVRVPSTAKVLGAMASGEFELPPGCSVRYHVDLVEMFRQLVRMRPRSAMDDYCRTVFEETGARPTAIQAYRAGLNPRSVRPWFGYLADRELLSLDEAEVYGRYGEVLDGFESEPVTKSYKLVTLLALLQDGMLRTGAGVSRIAETSHRIVSGDPRLVADVGPNADLPRDEWRAYWRRWPIAAWAGELKGEPGRWFRIDGERLVPTFAVEEALGETFDAMVAELVEYRLGRYLLDRQHETGRTIRCRVGQSNGRPLVWLDRARNPGLPEGDDIPLVADGETFHANFVKIALNVMRRPGPRDNALHEILRRWFGPDAGQPGTDHNVVFALDQHRWWMAPDETTARSIPDEATEDGNGRSAG